MSHDGSEDPECSHGKLLGAATQTDGMYGEAAELKEKIDGQSKFIEQLQQTIRNITMKIKPLSFSEQTFVSDDYVKFNTGLLIITILKAVFDHALPAVSVSGKLMPFQEYVAVLIKFHLNGNHQDLTYQLGVSMATISRIMQKWVNPMDIKLGPLILLTILTMQLNKVHT